MIKGSFAERLRILRAQRGLSLVQASERIGINRHTLRNLELEVREPHYSTVRKIAEGYGVTVDELLAEAGASGIEAPPLMLARMMMEYDEETKERALEGAPPRELQRYLDSIDRLMVGAGRNMAVESGPEGRQGWVTYLEQLEVLRREAEAYIDTPHEGEGVTMATGLLALYPPGIMSITGAA